MDRKTLFVFVSFCLAIGFCFEFMKGSLATHSTENRSRAARMDRLEQFMNEGQAVYRPSGDLTLDLQSGHNQLSLVKKFFQGKKQKNQSARPAQSDALAASLPNLDQTKKVDPSENASGKIKQSTQPIATQADKQKKKIAMLKKKKKLMDEKAKRQSTDAEKTEETDTVAQDTPAAEDPMVASPASPMMTAAQREESEQLLKSSEEWKTYLLPEASFEKVSKLIRSYQTGLVSSSVFYEVVTVLLTEQRTETRELAVMALGAAPSYRSFGILTAIRAEEPEGSKIKAQAQVYLRMYARLEHIRHLAGAMNLNGDSGTNLEALRLVKFAANLHLKTKKLDNTGLSEQGGPPAQVRSPAAAHVTRYFDHFVVVLARLSEMAKDAEVRSAASDALVSIRSLLEPERSAS